MDYIMQQLNWKESPGDNTAGAPKRAVDTDPSKSAMLMLCV